MRAPPQFQIFTKGVILVTNGNKSAREAIKILGEEVKRSTIRQGYMVERLIIALEKVGKKEFKEVDSMSNKNCRIRSGRINRCFRICFFVLICLGILAGTALADPLPSWNEGPTKQAVMEFVRAVTDKSSPNYVSPERRIATFDNDGTLWAEQPIYFQGFFTFDRVKALAPQHPEWKERQPFKAVLENDMKALAATGEKGMAEIIMTTHAGMTTGEFEKIVKDWLATAKHPRFNRPFTDLVYQPMIELLAYLRSNGFKTYIVSGGGVEFMRPWTEKVYGIPPEQVIGSSVKTKFDLRDGKPVLVRLPEINFVDDGPGKPVGIQIHIGRRPIAAFGNSDGDLQMLQWTAAGEGLRFMLLIRHTDAEREWAYDRQSPIGRLDKALDEAQRRGWTVVDMKKDWKRVFLF
jgi:phosphoglycolate phosphatase-like HAD superfamily hydrolase